MTVILGVKTQNRFDNSECIQRILTKYGCFIKTRLGLHDITESSCPKYALILLEIPDDEKAVSIAKLLLDIDGIEIQRMQFNFK